ncbi:MAG: hypothetical protein P4L87_07815 [Formivibrio sp.]|nr:hypothetical protein [Formivibrio sp.]
MNDEQKRLIDVLSMRRSWEWDSYNSRREYEWKVTIGVWTALAASLGLIISKDVTFPVEFIKFGSIALVVLLFCLHLWFLWGIQRANDADRDQVFFGDNLINKELDLKVEERVPRVLGIWNYAPSFQLAVTLLLGTCLVFVLFSKGTAQSIPSKSDCRVVNQIGDGNIEVK